MHLHIDPRSSSCLRVMCFLAYKQLTVPLTELRLMNGQHLTDDYAGINPARTVPALTFDSGAPVTQSLAIMEFFEDLHPARPTLPANPVDRARVRALCGLITSDMHPLTNMKVRQALAECLPGGREAAMAWCRRWTTDGLASLEALLAQTAGTYCFGNELTMADFCLAPQFLNAERFACDPAPYPIAFGIYQRCCADAAFAPIAAARTASV
jgi:maleylacetoacetate isomerase